jgi:AcrR family transcriptional regulator
MARGDTRERIQQVARELFLTRGVQATSLQDIATRLGITKPALYYHFASREELVRSIITPMLDDLEGYVGALEAAPEHDPRTLLEGFFDVHLKHRDILLLAVREMTTLEDLGLLDVAIGWRTRLGELLVGPDAPLARQCQVVVALGGLADCAWAFEHVPVETLRVAAVDAACGALGLAPAGPPQ